MTTTDASTTITLSPTGLDGLDCLIKADSAVGCRCPGVDAVEHLAHGRCAGDSGEFSTQVLLKGLAGSGRAGVEHLMDVGGQIPDQYVRHAFILLA